MKKAVLGSFFVFFFLAGAAAGFRISRPPTFSIPWTQDQVNQLNDFLESVWNLTNGEFNLDIVTTTKTNAAEGDIWIFNDGGTYKIEVKAGGSVRSATLSP